MDSEQGQDPTNWALILGIIAFLVAFAVWPGFRWFVLNILVNVLVSSGRSRGGFSTGGGFSGSSGGFSGGGGSSGGGGASGSW